MSRRKFTSSFKTKVVLEALSERVTIQELGQNGVDWSIYEVPYNPEYYPR